MAALTLGHSPRAPSLVKHQTFQVNNDKTILYYWQFLSFFECAQLCIENSDGVGLRSFLYQSNLFLRHLSEIRFIQVNGLDCLHFARVLEAKSIGKTHH